jgi:hypothetical protein
MTNEMQGFLQGVAVCAALALLMSVIEHRLRTIRHRNAIAVVNSVGLEAHHYTPSFEVDDDALISAFNELASSGYIVASPSGYVVGVICSTRGHARKQLVVKPAPI